jgi:ribosome biogenesis GTPase
VHATGDVRAHDHGGRHVTTHRELVPLPGGALLVDTPGMRELAPWAGGAEGASPFQDVEELAGGCRFTDCRHDGEPACAVAGAIASGALDAERLQSWRKLQKELAWQAEKHDPLAAIERRRRWKAIHKSARARQKES